MKMLKKRAEFYIVKVRKIAVKNRNAKKVVQN